MRRGGLGWEGRGRCRRRTWGKNSAGSRLELISTQLEGVVMTMMRGLCWGQEEEEECEEEECEDEGLTMMAYVCMYHQ